MFKILENLKIREIIYRYRDFKISHPDFNHDQLCRLTVSKRLSDYPNLYNQRDNSDDRIQKYIDDVFKNELDLKYVCQWFMEQEYPKYNLLQNSKDLEGWRIRVKKLEDRIERLIAKVPGI